MAEIKEMPISDSLKRLLALPARAKMDDYDTYSKADLFAIRMYNRAISGNTRDAKEILDRVEGKVAQVLAGDPNNPLRIDLATALDRAIRLHDSMTIDNASYSQPAQSRLGGVTDICLDTQTAQPPERIKKAKTLKKKKSTREALRIKKKKLEKQTPVGGGMEPLIGEGPMIPMCIADLL